MRKSFPRVGLRAVPGTGESFSAVLRKTARPGVHAAGTILMEGFGPPNLPLVGRALPFLAHPAPAGGACVGNGLDRSAVFASPHRLKKLEVSHNAVAYAARARHEGAAP